MRIIRFLLIGFIAIFLLPITLILSILNQPVESKNQNLFINQIYECYLKTDKYIKPSLILAQAVLESGNGLDDNAIKNNNYFGIMQKGKLKKFKSMQENVNYYHNLLIHKPYNLKNVDWGMKMKKALSVYSTSKNYYQTLVNVRDSYGLLNFDKPNSKQAIVKNIAININSKGYQTNINPYFKKYYGQCTWFAWGRIYELYNLNSKMYGNGKECVDELIKNHKFKTIKKINNITNKAIFSTKSGSIYGHVGIIEQYNKKTDKLVVSEGNFKGYLYKVNVYSVEEFMRKYGYGLKIAIN